MYENGDLEYNRKYKTFWLYQVTTTPEAGEKADATDDACNSTYESNTKLRGYPGVSLPLIPETPCKIILLSDESVEILPVLYSRAVDICTKFTFLSSSILGISCDF